MQKNFGTRGFHKNNKKFANLITENNKLKTQLAVIKFQQAIIKKKEDMLKKQLEKIGE